ncbi:YscG family type III secretion protein, partial [Vibrio parahaemolyticus]|nr:YscG family type III secretion protein [Vibrio parahaemolyticus]
MERETRQLLAEIALMATGMHRHQEANTIADGLEASSGSEETVAMIRAMGLMNKGLYEEAH